MFVMSLVVDSVMTQSSGVWVTRQLPQTIATTWEVCVGHCKRVRPKQTPVSVVQEEGAANLLPSFGPEASNKGVG